MSEHSDSVQSLDSIYSDGCPVSPSLLYDQRSRMIETRKSQIHRNAMTAYRSRKSSSILGNGAFLWLQNDANIIVYREKRTREKARTERNRYQATQPFYHQRNQQPQAMISICI